MTQSCATFKSEFQNEVKLNTTNINSVNGRYKILPIKIDTTNEKYNQYKLEDNFLVEIERKPFASFKNKYDEDEINYFVELEIRNPNLLEIRFLKEDKVFNSKNVKVKLKKDGYLYLKNENVKFWGIPYLFGAMDINKIRISVDKENNLVLDTTNFRGGAIFLIGFINGGKTLYRKKLKKIK